MTTAFARKILSSFFLKSPYIESGSRFSLPPYHFSTSSESGQTMTTEFLIKRHHFPPDAAKCVSSIFPCLKNPQKTDSVLSFLRELGLTNTQLVRIVTCMPRLVSSSPANLGSKVKIFSDFGFSGSEIAEIIKNDPFILRFSLDRISSSLSVLKSLLGSNERLSHVLRKHKRLIRCDYEKVVLPNIRFLNDCGISMQQINTLMNMSPQFFLHVKPDTMRKLVDITEKMGVDRNSRMFVYAVRSLSSMTDENRMLKFKFFRDLGFTEDNIVKMLKSSPTSFSLSEQKIKRVIEVILESGKYDFSCIVKCPTSLTYSVDKRYKPRLQILKDLEKKGLIDKWPCLGVLCQLSDDVFCTKFVDLTVMKGQ